MKHGVSPARLLRGVVVLGLFAVLAGCSPRYDWRMVTVGDGRVRAMLPDSPRTAERELEFEGHMITFVLTSASVDNVLFTVGYAALPEALRENERQRLLRQTQQSLYQNLGVDPPATLPAAGERFFVTGEGSGTPLRLEGMIWTTADALIEGFVIGAADALPPDEMNEFWRELAPDLQPGQ